MSRRMPREPQLWGVPDVSVWKEILAWRPRSRTTKRYIGKCCSELSGLFSQRLDTRQLFARQKLHRSAAAGGDVSDLLGDAGLGQGCDRIAAAHNAGSGSGGHHFRNANRPSTELGNFKYTHRT